MRTRKDIERRAELFDLHVSTWAPGDGKTRYLFSATADEFFAGDRIAPGDLRTALGLKEAERWLDGYAYALRVIEDEEARLEPARVDR